MNDVTARPNSLPWPPIIFLAAIAVSVFLNAFYPLPWFAQPLSGILSAIGWLMIAAFVALNISAVRAMRRAGTTVRPDRGTDHLVTEGPFDEQLLGLEHDLVLSRIDGHDFSDRSTGMLDSERTKSTRRKHLESLAMKECCARIFRLFVEIVSQSLQTGLEILLGICRPHLQAYAEAPPTGRQRQPLHDRLRRRHQQDRFLRLGEAPQYRAPSAGDLSGRLHSIKWQGVQPRKHQHVERGVERMEHATEPLCPVLVFGKEYDAVTAGLPPLFEEMERQHAEWRRRGDRRTR
jgi:hypothetical protein